MLNLLAVGGGGFLGALLRYFLARWADRLESGEFPLGTWLVNVLGCLCLGALFAWMETASLPLRLRLFLATGLLGAFTTFSTFGYESFELLRKGAAVEAAFYVATSLGLGLGAVALGHGLVGALLAD